MSQAKSGEPDMSNERPDGLLLAAGGARRFGAPKLLAPLGGVPLLWHTLDVFCAAPLARRSVVFGAHGEALKECYLQWCASRGGHSSVCAVVENPAWDRGLSESLRVGLDALERRGAQDAQKRSVLVMLADQPLVTAPHLENLVQAWSDLTNGRGGGVQGDFQDAMGSHGESHFRLVVASDYDGVAGVPALFSPEALPRLRTLLGDVGARRLLNTDASLTVHRMPFPAWQRLDVDEPEDLERAREEFEGARKMKL